MYIPSATTYSAAAIGQYLTGQRQNITAKAVTGNSETLTISQSARDALARSSASEDDATAKAKMEAINAKGIMARTAEEIDYQQKTGGFVNTMAALSDDEKKLYNDMVSSGNTQAAAGLAQVAFLRATMGHQAGGKDGSSYDPSAIALTAANITNFFMHSFADSSGTTASQLQALARYLDALPQLK